MPHPARPADRLLLSAARHSTARAAALCLLTTAGAAVALALPAALGRTLDLLLAGGDAAGSTTRWTLVCAALICASVALDAVRTVLTGTTDARTTAWLRGLLTGRVLAIGPAGAARFTHGDLVTRATVNAGHAGAGPAAAATTVAAVLTPLGGIAALALIDYRLALAFLAGAPLLALLLRSFARSTADCVARYQRVQGDLAGRLVEALAGARTVAAAGTEERERRRVLEPLAGLSDHGHRLWRVQGRASAQAAALVPLLLLVVVAVGGLLLTAGALSVGALLAATRYAALAAGAGALVGHLGALVRSRQAAGRIAEVLQVPPVRYGDRETPPGTGRLELRGVTVRRGGRAVLRDLCLTVPAGTTVAVVGRSGSGKSLLASVAGRLADPDAGEVLLDGVPLRELDRAALRREIGYAFARPALLGGTIGGTIGFGPAPASPERVTAAARAACADGFVRTLPEGYDTPCARAPLSGGEEQRLGLARAFAHRGRLLILDDATSSLDTVTELRVGRALSRDSGDRTRLVIAHRPATADRADLVAWLDDGGIRAVGPHRELWRRADYRAVWRN
ncbi:ABC transporter ATP-binding protein [Streptomyces sodiiphilus]|uniref:ABC transporter ATP-binding protein n=1 Tax=Streptomyces sodiiphilus TaxID=226217 RepID=A0ABP5A3A1_9ACTN